MLAAMTFNVWLFLAAVTGSTAGQFIFNPNAKAIIAAAAASTATATKTDSCPPNAKDSVSLAEQKELVVDQAQDEREKLGALEVEEEVSVVNPDIARIHRGGPQVVEVDVHHHAAAASPPESDTAKGEERGEVAC